MRWDGDTSGRGVADATAFVGGAAQLLEAMRQPDWVAEEPEAHLLPHVEAACRKLPFELREARTADDGTFHVDLAWRGEAGVGRVRSALYALIGSFAESATYVRQQSVNGSLVFDVVTGMGGEDSPFTPHGHTVRLNVAVD